MSLSRRAILRMLGAAAPAAAMAPVSALFAGGSAAAYASLTAARPSPGMAPEQEAATKLQVGLFSRHVQWTSVEDAIDVAREIGFDAIEWTVRPGAHIAPERVETDLPKVVALTRKAGLAVPMIATAIVDAESPHAEAILRTAQGLGIRYYRGGMFTYDYAGDLERQLEALKPRVGSLVELNRKHGMTIAYHTHSGRGNIGGNVWDLWTVIKTFDPQVIGLNYDTAHTAARGGTGWVDAAHVALKYIRGLAIKDFKWARRTDGAWAVEFCPIGEGMVDFKGVFTLLKSASFRGPINIHLEHHNLLGSDVGTWKLDMPREGFVSIVKADLDRVRALMHDANFT